MAVGRPVRSCLTRRRSPAPQATPPRRVTASAASASAGSRADPHCVCASSSLPFGGRLTLAILDQSGEQTQAQVGVFNLAGVLARVGAARELLIRALRLRAIAQPVEGNGEKV